MKPVLRNTVYEQSSPTSNSSVSAGRTSLPLHKTSDPHQSTQRRAPALIPDDSSPPPQRDENQFETIDSKTKLSRAPNLSRFGYSSAAKDSRMDSNPKMNAPEPSNAESEKKKSRRSRRHRQTASDNIPRDVIGSDNRGYYSPQQQPQYAPYPDQRNPGQYGPPPHPPYYPQQHPQAAPYPYGYGGLPPMLVPPPGQYTSNPGQMQASYQYQPPQASPSGDLPSGEAPPVENTPTSSRHRRQWSASADGGMNGGDLRPPLQMSQSERSKLDKRVHRRSLSSSAATSQAYRAFFDNESAAAVPSPSFSARGEFMKVTGIGSKSPRSTNSPTMGGMHRKNSSLQQFGLNNASMRMNMTPPISPYQLSPSGTPHSPYMTGNMPPSPYMSAGMPPPIPNYGSEQQSLLAGGEALFRNNSNRRPESTRKRHVRQLSAQLYMEDTKGVEQPPACRDVVWLLIFVFHLLALAYLNTEYSYEALEIPNLLSSDESVTVYYRNLLIMGCASAGFSMITSALLLAIMTMFARNFLQVILMAIIGLSFVWGTMGVGLSSKSVVPVTGIIMLAVTVGYAFIVWDRVKFAASNLLVGLTALRAFPGTLFVAFFFQLACTVWVIYFSVVFFGVYDAMQAGRIKVSHNGAIAVYSGFGVSFFWTYHVLLNFVRVATAGVIGSWWYQPEGEGAAVKRSALKTVFYSMGSVCYGSLFIGPMQVVHQLAALSHPSSDDASVLCFHVLSRCLLTCISNTAASMWRRMNIWGLTCVGLYGYGMVDASCLATDLFHKRGWTAIVNDDLVPNILLITSLVNGGITGCVALMLSGRLGLHVLSIEEPALVSFITGTLIGAVITRVLFGVIGSSVNTVIVCFASSPVDFEENHPALSQEMRAAWREVWPDALDIVDMNLAMSTESTYQDPTMSPMV